MNNFNFWCPIEKANTSIDPTTGEEVMCLGGIASTADEDSDGESLDPKGFDVTPLLTSGMVNWHHQAKGSPATIIGEPRKAEIRKEGLYLETILYPSSAIARDVWNLAQVLEKDSTTRRLGYSIEGKVLKRKSNDKNSPDYKKIEKAVITGVAITHQPKNPKTFANIIKGEIDNDFEEEEGTEEKSMNTESASALRKESVDGVKKLSKAEVFDRIFSDIPSITIEKAEKIYVLIQNIANMKKRKHLTEADIEKAYDALGLEYNSDSETVKKAEDDSEEEETEKAEETEEEEEEKEEKKETEKAEGTEEETEKAETDSFDRIEKAIISSHRNQVNFIKALGVMVKDVAQKADAIMSENERLQSIIKAQDETISEMSERLESFGSEVNAPKSISSARAVERTFGKGMENEFEKAEKESANTVSMSKQPAIVADILDKATFNKGYDEEFSKACTSFEATKTLPASIIARVKNEFGIEIIK